MRSRLRLRMASACIWSGLSGYNLLIRCTGGSGRSEGERRSAVEPRVLPRARTSGELPMHRQRPDCDLCMMYTVASTERLTAAMQRLQGLDSSACTSARPERPRSHVISIGISHLQRRNFSVSEPSKSARRSARSRGHFCDVLASECPCRAAGEFQPAPIRRLEALCTARTGTRMSLNRFQGESHGQPLKRRVDAAYLQPCGFRFQFSRFLPAEHQSLLRRLATWQL